MKAEELMIGNYVWFTDRQGNKEVTKIKPMQLYYLASGKFDTTLKTKVEPIELTEEWLAKFGFNQISNTNIYVKKMHQIAAKELKSLAVYIDENDYTVALVDYYTGIEKTELLHKNYKYVHDLQILFFSLTGNHLKI